MRPADFMIVSSMPLRMVIVPEPRRLVATCIALSLPLIVVHDGPDARMVKIPEGVHAVNIFEVMPTMRLLTNPGSPIDAFYAAAGTAEPFEKNLKRHGIASGKLLVRKVGAMAFALALAMHGGAIVPDGARVVLWADADVEFLKPPDRVFLEFALRHDVSYIPFVKQDDLVNKTVRHDLLHDGWRLDSGLMAFRAGANGLGLVAAALDLYEGGLLRLWRKCELLAATQPCPAWLTRNLYMNDVYVWALLLHAAAHAASGGGGPDGGSLPRFLASELRAFNLTTLSQGWFAYVYDKRLRKNLRGQPKTATKAFITFAYPAATPFTSPFELRDYICHHILSGPYSRMRIKAYRDGNSHVDSLLRIERADVNDSAAAAAHVGGVAVASERAVAKLQTEEQQQAATRTTVVARACAEHGVGLTLSECAALREFTRALVGHDECYSQQASDALRHEVANQLSIDERWRWQSLPASTQPEAAYSRGARWLTLSAGVPCNASWWIPRRGGMYAGSARWTAAPEWAHANNKGPSIALCPGNLLRMGSSPCTTKMNALKTDRRKRCHDDALPLCEPFLFGGFNYRDRGLVSHSLGGRRGSSPGCLAYSFGIGGEWTFEDWMAKRCEVHAFDPTTALRAQHESHALGRGPNLSFHYEGLGLRTGGSASSLVSGVYGKLGGAIRPLDELLRSHGHSDRHLDFLKIDCEGCEWETFVDIAERTPQLLSRVCTLVMEVHVSTQLQMGTTHQLARMAAFWRNYVEEAGFRLWYMHRNPGSPKGIDNHVHPLLVALGMDERVCCFEIGLHRPQCGVEPHQRRHDLP